MSKLNQILEHTIKFYLQNGIKSVTMDDIAKQLGISKKTLYQFVKDKADLVSKVIEYHLEAERDYISRIFTDDYNAIDELFGISEFMCRQMQEMHPSVIFDIQKYYPEVWQQFVKHKHGFIYDNILNNINKGRKQGIYRKDFQTDIVTKFYIMRMEALRDITMFPPNEYQFADLIFEYRNHHIRGIVNEKGIKYLEKKLSK